MTEQEIRQRLKIPAEYVYTQRMKDFYNHLVSERFRECNDLVKVYKGGKIERMPVSELMRYVDTGRKYKIGVYDNDSIENLDADFVIVDHAQLGGNS